MRRFSRPAQSIVQNRINRQIIAKELRVIGPEGENHGILSLQNALALSEKEGLDLIEISPKAVPPIAKIMDYGKFQYDQKKKQKASKAKTAIVEVKTVQVKIGTGEHDLSLKAGRVSEWLKEGHRVKIDLFLRGRSKYMDFEFLKERLGRILKLVSEPYGIAEEPKKSPKGLSVLIEKERGGKTKQKVPLVIT